MSSHAPGTVRIATLVVTGALALTGCQGKPQGGLLSQFQHARVTESELQANVDEFVFLFISAVETAAAEIYMASDDRVIRGAALRWAIGMNLECMRSNYADDAYSNMIDVAALSGQQLDYLTNGEGRMLFGEHQHVAVAAATRLLDEAERLLEDTLGDEVSDEGVEKMQQFIAANPIEGVYLTRRSTDPLIAQMQQVAPVNVWSNLKAMDRGVRNIGTRLEVLNDQLPKQILWQAEMMINRRFDPLLDKVDRSLDMVEALPETVAKEREAILAALAEERAVILEDVDRQRRETLVEIEAVVGETTAAIDQTVQEAVARVDHRVERSVAASLEQMTAATDKAVASIDETLIGAIAEVDGRVGRTIAEERDITFEAIEGFIDRLFVRILQLGGIGFAAVVIAVYVLRRTGRAI